MYKPLTSHPQKHRVLHKMLNMALVDVSFRQEQTKCQTLGDYILSFKSLPGNRDLYQSHH